MIVKVSTAPLLVSRNASYGWPAAAAGSTQTPLTSVPPLVAGEHSRVIGRDWASAGAAAPMPASRAPASSDPAATTAATVFLIMSSSGNGVWWSAAGGQFTVSVDTALAASITARPGTIFRSPRLPRDPLPVPKLVAPAANVNALPLLSA